LPVPLRSMMEGACGIHVNRYADAPSTVLTRGPPSPTVKPRAPYSSSGPALPAA
jgi:hypothetical protein